jgi:hypothetical protein
VPVGEIQLPTSAFRIEKAQSLSSRPDLFAGKSPSATTLKGFSASIPQFRHFLPASRPAQKLAALAREFFGQRYTCLPQLGVWRFKR